MKRRDFLTTGAAGAAITGVLGMANNASANDVKDPRQFIEVRTYTVKNDDKRAEFISVLENAVIPAANQLGVKPVGVFIPRSIELPEHEQQYRNCVFVVLPSEGVNRLARLDRIVAHDDAYSKNAAPIFAATSKDPLYTACESLLLYSFESTPTLTVPKLGADRIFQYRIYRSFNIERNAAKVRMFEEGGALALFRKCGLNPVFFGEAVAGKALPNMSYMIGCENEQKHDEAWKEFVASPEWHKLKADKTYADTATEIHRVILKPTAKSQI